MACVEGASKNSLTPEMASCGNEFTSPNGVVAGDDFSVDDLLDFSNGGVEDGFFEAEEEPEHQVSVSVQKQDNPVKEEDEDLDPSNSYFLSLPSEELEDLEWLSHFVEDSFSPYSLTYPTAKLPDQPEENRAERTEILVPAMPCFATPVQTKARTKRARTGGRVWSLGSRPLTESSSSSISSTSSSGQSQTADSLLGLPPKQAEAAKKQKRKRQEATGGGVTQQPRRCSHCGVQKTPQWRAGPLGAKTLCNACGVRFKSGRLLPEYRPACSPTFSSDIHSNNHRKVMEMRRKKELEAGFTPPVQSF
ncbi:hypothetical protein NMG60_11026272 [Bertholletia excelsa]